MIFRLQFVIVFISLVAANAFSIISKNANPKSGLRETVQINNETFYFGLGDHSTWNSAKQKCKLLGMQLVTLDTEERWKMISDWLFANPSYNYWWWSSGQKLMNQEVYEWTTTGQIFNYTDWYIGEPSCGPEEESCVDFYARAGWEDDNCNDLELMYMCEAVPQ